MAALIRSPVVMALAVVLAMLGVARMVHTARLQPAGPPQTARFLPASESVPRPPP